VIGDNVIFLRATGDGSIPAFGKQELRIRALRRTFERRNKLAVLSFEKILQVIDHIPNNHCHAPVAGMNRKDRSRGHINPLPKNKKHACLSVRHTRL
jgi:hypothetical protein